MIETITSVISMMSYENTITMSSSSINLEIIERELKGIQRVEVDLHKSVVNTSNLIFNWSKIKINYPTN